MKYRFEITYSNKLMVDVGNLMSKLDLNIHAIAVTETYILTTKEEKQIEKLKQLLTQAFESVDCKVWEIKGGKYE